MISISLIKRYLFCLIAGAFSICCSDAQTGFLDCQTSINSRSNVPRAITLDTNNNIIVVCTHSGSLHSTVLRFDGGCPLNNIPLPTFSKTGDSEYSYAVAVDKQNRILLAGNSINTPGAPSGITCFLAERFQANGEPDSSFGGNGFSRRTEIYGNVGTVLPLPNGKTILVGQGRKSLTDKTGFTLVRLSSDGQLDSSFGSSGAVITYVDAYPGSAAAGFLMPDGKILVGGVVNTNYQSSFSIVRYLPDGIVDSSFGINGAEIFPGNGAFGGPGSQIPNDSYVIGLFVRPDSSIVLTGGIVTRGRRAQIDTTLLFMGCAFKDGTLNQGFGVGGVVRESAGSVYGVGGAAGLSDGEIIVIKGGNLIRYYANGSRDHSFSIPSTWLSNASAIMAQPDDKVIVAGLYWRNYPGPDSLFVSRYRSLASLSSTLTNRNQRDIYIFPNPASNVLNVQSGGAFANGSVYYVASLDGRQLASGSLTGNTTSISLLDLPPGTYLLSVLSPKSKTSRLFSKG